VTDGTVISMSYGTKAYLGDDPGVEGALPRPSVAFA
jgi:hypothetical protein